MPSPALTRGSVYVSVLSAETFDSDMRSSADIPEVSSVSLITGTPSRLFLTVTRTADAPYSRAETIAGSDPRGAASPLPPSDITTGRRTTVGSVTLCRKPMTESWSLVTTASTPDSTASASVSPAEPVAQTVMSRL